MTNLSCCGLDCAACSMCKGCRETKGKPFYLPKDKACAIYMCAVHEKNYEDCSKCKNLPCPVWRDTRDPSFTDEEFENNIIERIANFKSMAE